MVEKNHPFALTDEKTIEKLIEDDHVAVNHMVLLKGDALPEHFANSNVTMLVVRGTVTLKLDDQEPHAYPKGSILSIPFRTKMNVSNQDDGITELFVVKAPSPRMMQGM
jgi:quercetin dioxygenase-like cupin family protein